MVQACLLWRLTAIATNHYKSLSTDSDLNFLSGHRNISTTQRYITVNDDVKRSAVELV